MQACLDNGSATALTLAFDCSTDGHPLAPELRDRLGRTLKTAFEDDADPAHRRLVAAVLATRLARLAVTAATGSRVCTRPIPTGLYWLFLHDTHALAPHGPCPPEADGATPVTGVWGAEALAFVSWLNEITVEAAGQDRYRLPTRPELTDQAVRDALAPHFAGPRPLGCLWTRSSAAAVPEPWRPPEQPDPHTIVGTTMQQAVNTDTATTPVLLLLRLTTASALTSVRVRVLVRDLDRARAVLEVIASRSVGQRLGMAFVQALAPEEFPSEAEAGTRFAAALMSGAGIQDTTQIVVPFDGSLNARVRESCTARRRSADHSPSGWSAATVAEHLADLATQLLD